MWYFKFLITILNKIPHNKNLSQVEQVLAAADTIRFHPYLHACKPQAFHTRKDSAVSLGQRKVSLRKETAHHNKNTNAPGWLQQETGFSASKAYATWH